MGFSKMGKNVYFHTGLGLCWNKYCFGLAKNGAVMVILKDLQGICDFYVLLVEEKYIILIYR